MPLKNLEARKEYGRKYRLNNKNRCRRWSRSWRLANPEKRKESYERYRDKNKARLYLIRKRWVEKNHEKHNAQNRAWRKNHPPTLDQKARVKEYNRNKYLKNPQKYRAMCKRYELWHRQDREAYRKKYYAKNKDQIRAKARAYHWEHREQRIASKKAWAMINKHRCREYANQWRRNHPARARKTRKGASMRTYRRHLLQYRAKAIAHAHRRRSHIAQTCDSIKKVQAYIVALRTTPGLVCNYCKTSIYGNRVTVDHFIPVSRNGKHQISNFRPCCSDCNYSKNDKLPEDFSKYRLELGLPIFPDAGPIQVVGSNIDGGCSVEALV